MAKRAPISRHAAGVAVARPTKRYIFIIAMKEHIV
jgi:hypothetical protein